MCLARQAPRDRHGYLITALKSDKKVDGPVFELCRRLLWFLNFSAIQLNHNVAAGRHKDRNEGDSWVLLFGAVAWRSPVPNHRCQVLEAWGAVPDTLDD